MSDKENTEEHEGLAMLVQSEGACCGGTECCSTSGNAEVDDDAVVEISPVTETFVILSSD